VDVTNPNHVSGTPLNYTFAMITFACFGVLALFFAVLLKKVDRHSGFGLELPTVKK
jgi:hypothetical protein